MQQQDQEFKNRYIYQVVRRVPKKQRKEITMELEELIDDMYEANDHNIENVLMQLGNPKDTAKKYLNFNGYLIGPEYFDNYFFILKIVLLCVGISTFVSGFFNFNYSSLDFGELVSDVIMNTIVGLIGAFGFVTLVFAVLEYMQVKVDLQKKREWSVDDLENAKPKQEESWNPNQLKPIPVKKAMISRADSVVSIVIIMVLCSIVAFFPDVIAAYVSINSDSFRHIPIFNLDKWSVLCPFFLAIFLVGFIDEVVKLVTGCYCKLVLFSSVITNAIQLVLFTVLFKFFPVFNPNFAKELEIAYDTNFNANGDLLAHWGTSLVTNIVLAILWAISLVEMGITIYKTMRYGKI